MNCIEIIEKYLKDNGFDGLYVGGVCACKIGDLIECESMAGNCEPGYFVDKNSEDFDPDYDFMIGPDKP